jgi:hypothetical protein
MVHVMTLKVKLKTETLEHLEQICQETSRQKIMSHLSTSQCLWSYSLQNVIKIASYGLTSELFCIELWHSYWWPWGKLSSRNIYDGEVLLGQVEPQYVGWLLLDTGKGCPSSEAQA